LKSRITRSWKFLSVAGIAIFFTAIFYRQEEQSREARDGALNTYEAQKHLQSIYSELRDLESGVRGYALTGDTLFLDTLRNMVIRNVADDRELFSNLRSSREERLWHNEYPQQSLNKLEGLINTGMGQFQEILRARKEQRGTAASLRFRSGEDLADMDSIQATVNIMLSEDDSLLSTRQLQAQRETLGNNILLYGGMALFFIGWLVLLWRANRFEKHRLGTELALEDSDALIHAIMDGGKHAIFVADQHQIIKSFNRASERLYGFEAAHFIGRPLSDLGKEFHLQSEFETEARRLSEEFGRTIRADEVFNLSLQKHGFYENEWTVIRGDGAKICIRLTVSLIRNENNKVYGYLCIAQDVTERTLMEHEIKQHAMLLRAVMDGGKYGIIMTDRNRNVIVFNRAAERMYGYDATYFLGESISDFVHKIHLLSELEEETESLRNESGLPVKVDDLFLSAIQKYGIYEREWTAIRKDGVKIPILLTLTTIRDQDGKNSGSMGIFQDITERKELDRAKSEFISTASHELRTPLTSIRGALGMVIYGKLGHLPEKVTEALTIAYRNCERLVLIINDILDVEKMESGKLLVHFKAVGISEILNQALEANRNYGEKYGVQFILKGVPRDEQVWTDPDRLMQIMANLLSNAAKFSLQDSEVWVCAECRGNRVYFSVQDFGIGIPGTFREKIFEKFTQADHSNTRHNEGTGLGLSIARNLVEALHGSIHFETEIGAGTTFMFDLPKAKRLDDSMPIV
jgi:PAS domain S-box-containing protein